MLKPHYRIEMKNSDYTSATYVYKQKKTAQKKEKLRKRHCLCRCAS